MSDDNKSGSELDIFEGLGKKSSTTRSSAAPPPPPPGGASSEARVSAAPPAPPQPVEVKKTLLGIAAPLSPQTSVAPAARPSRPPLPPSSSTITAARPSQPSPPRPSQNPDAPPPPPKRASLPNLQAATLIKTPTAASQDAVATEPLATGAKLDMDWDDDNEATHVYDKDKADKPEESTLDDSKELETAPVLAGGAAKARSSMPPPPPPGSQSMRAASAPPPPPPPSAMPSTRPAGSPPSSAGLRSSTPPPLPPQNLGNLENQTVTEPLIPPTPSRPPSLPPPPPAGLAVARTPSVAPPPPNALPIESQMTSRSMEATQMVRRSGASRNGMLFLLLVAVAVCAGLAVYFAMPRSGKLVINVTDPKGAAVANLEVLVEGKKVCDTAPCVTEVSSGVHRIQVQAPGYQPAAPKAVSVDGNLNLDFVLTPSGATGASTVQGTGIKVNGAQPGFRLMVDGKDVGPLPQEVRDLTPGEHKIKILGGAVECTSADPAVLKRCRYAPLEKTVTVSKDEMVDLGALPLKVVLGKVTILPGTPGAKVFLVSGGDRKVLAELPKAVEIDTTKASWTLEAEKTGYNDFSQPISFDDGQAEKSITVNLEPKGAKVASAAAVATPTPSPKAEVAPKPEAKVETPKEEPKPETSAPKEEPKAETASGMGTLKINSLPASAVLVDGKPIGQTPVLSYKVAAGEHNIRFVNTELSLQKQITVTVKAGETKAAFAKLRD